MLNPLQRPTTVAPSSPLAVGPAMTPQTNPGVKVKNVPSAWAVPKFLTTLTQRVSSLWTTPDDSIRDLFPDLKKNARVTILLRDGTRHNDVQVKSLQKSGIVVTAPNSKQPLPIALPQILCVRPLDQNGHPLDLTRSWTHPSITVPQLSDLTVLPALSLGKKHHVLIEFADPKITNLLSNPFLTEPRAAMSEGEYDMAKILEDVWKKFRHEPNPSANDLLDAQSQRGSLHAVSDIIAKIAATKEKAILLQLAFQYLGIPSELYFGRTTIQSAIDDIPGAKGDHTYWVVARPDGLPETIFCPSSSYDPISENDPSFRQFTGMPVHRAFSDAARDETKVSVVPGTETPEAVRQDPDKTKVGLMRDLTRAPDNPVADEGSFADNTRVVPKDEFYKTYIQKELQLRYPTILGSGSKKTDGVTESLATYIYMTWRKHSDVDHHAELISIPDELIDTSLTSLEKTIEDKPKTAKNLATLQLLADLKADDQRKHPGRVVAHAQAQLPRAPQATIPPPVTTAATVTPSASSQSDLRLGVDAVVAKVKKESSDQDEALGAIRETLLSRYPLFKDKILREAEAALVGQVYQIAHKNKRAYDRNVKQVVQELKDALASAIKHNPPNQAALEKTLQEIIMTDAIHDEIIERYPVFSEKGWRDHLPKALEHIFHTWRLDGSRLETKYRERFVMPEETFEDGFDQFREKLTLEHPNEHPDLFVKAFEEGDRGPRAKRWTSQDSFPFSGVYDGDSEVFFRSSPQFREIQTALGDLASKPGFQTLAQDLTRDAWARGIGSQKIIQEFVLALAQIARRNPSQQTLFERFLAATKPFRQISEALGPLSSNKGLKEPVQDLALDALKRGVDGPAVLRELTSALSLVASRNALQDQLLQQLQK